MPEAGTPRRGGAHALDAARVLHEIGAGERVDGFHVGEIFHEGGMARLYRVTHARHRGPLIMKVPKLGPHGPLSSWAAFENEVRILERLRGPHVPRFVAAGDFGKAPYLVTEYIEGDRFDQAMRGAPVDVGQLRTLGAALCKAVHELHRQNVIHLDLSPKHARNRDTGEIVLIDFGLAHHAQIPDMIDAAFGEEEGTTPYIAPEQVRHVRTESRSDIYAIGAILYLLATGAYPFGRPNLLSVKRRLFQPPPPPRRHNPDVPPWLQEVILRCLEIDPEQRYATPKQIAYLLAHPQAVPLTPRAHRTRPADPWTRARLWFRSLYQVFDEKVSVRPYERLAGALHVLVPLDLSQTSESLREVLRNTVRKFARNEPHSFFTFLAVVRDVQANPAEADAAGEIAPNVMRLAEMRNWAQPLRLPPERTFFQVVPGDDPATAIVDYARQHVIDHIILGARGSSGVRRLLGDVSSRVVSESPCSVTVVRSRRDGHVSERTRGV